MGTSLRQGTPADAPACGRICFDAFTRVAKAHGFPPDFPSEEVAVGLIGWCLSNPTVYSVVAEVDGRIVGSNFLWEGGAVSGVGPITVDPAAQNNAAGRLMMEDVIARAGWGKTEGEQNRAETQRRHAGVRLVQAGYHCRSLALYAKLGFQAREHLACMQGARPRLEIPGRRVRTATMGDISACGEVCREVHGIDRRVELEGAIAQGTALVVETQGVITGYSTLLGFFGHAVGRSNDDLKALIGGVGGAGGDIAGPGLLVPTRNAELFRWCLDSGLRVTQTMTLMSLGLYQEPCGSWWPSVLY